MLLAIQNTMLAKAYKIYSRPFELNIVGVRANSTVPNSFDDTVIVFYKNNSGDWKCHNFPAPPDPGTFWLRTLINPQGTAIVKQGQYIGSHGIGIHRGKYQALTQKRPLTVIRDYDRDAVLDFNNGKEQTGIFGINIHRASVNGTTKFVEKHSAGCQVFANIDDFNLFMQLAQRHKQLYGNDFTYTLIDERALVREAKKN